jgi:hypothetical protein
VPFRVTTAWMTVRAALLSVNVVWFTLATPSLKVALTAASSARD